MAKNTVRPWGGLLIHKPAGMTSHHIVAILRHIEELKDLKIGHSGTLDPFATGLLLVLIGSATRLQDEIHMLPKTYITTITLGATSDTDDCTGILTPKSSDIIPSRTAILACLLKIRQTTTQVPPQYSAIKIRGKKMYEYARKGEVITAKARAITIHAINLIHYEYPNIQVEVTCSTGTYIRSIARNIGDILGTGAYCSVLERTAIGPFILQNAFLPENLPKPILNVVIPGNQLVTHIPAITCSKDTVAKYKQGKEGECGSETPIQTPIALLDTNQLLFGIGIRETDALTIKTKKIFL